MVENDIHCGKALSETGHLRKPDVTRLHDHRDAFAGEGFPCRKGSTIVEEARIKISSAASRENAKPSNAALEPATNDRGRIRRQQIDRAHTIETARMGLNCVSEVRIIETIAGRSLHDRGLVHARFIHSVYQVVDGDGPLLGPVGLEAKEWFTGILRIIQRDDMGMGVDIVGGHSLRPLREVIQILKGSTNSSSIVMRFGTSCCLKAVSSSARIVGMLSSIP